MKWNPGHAEKIAAALDMSVTDLETAWLRGAGAPTRLAVLHGQVVNA